MNHKKGSDHLTVDDVRFESPKFSSQQVAKIASDLFGVSGAMVNLGGERDQNTRISTEDGSQFVLKISGALEDSQTVDFQVKALLHIESADPTLSVPRMIRGADGNWVQNLEVDNQTYQVRLLSYLSGVPYSGGPYPSGSGLQGIGSFLARLGQALSDFTHPASTAFMAWDIGSDLPFSDQFRGLVPDEAKSLCLPILDDLQERVFPLLAELRRQVIHQDAHGWNLLRVSNESEEVAGMIDFGDMVEGPLISDLAVCASHFSERSDDPHDIVRSLCQGYHPVMPLRPEELDVLPDLVMTRQILTLQLYEFRRVNMPHDPPQDEEEKPRVIASLRRLASLDRQALRNELRSVCRT